MGGACRSEKAGIGGTLGYRHGSPYSASPPSGRPAQRITVTRLDKSKHRYSQPHARQPQRGEIIKTVVGGKLVKAEIDFHYLDRLRAGQIAAWKVEATEIWHPRHRTRAAARSRRSKPHKAHQQPNERGRDCR
jgi:hypothetical protein